MTFYSYAQNFEDVILNRVFRDVPNGFYIDVGAHDPKKDSVTHAFYQEGWRGLNIEPVAHYVKALCNKRPEDINEQVAAADYIGKAIFYEIVGTGLSSLIKDMACRAVHEFGHTKRKFETDVTTLDALCEKHGLAEVQFMKVDVEGAEEQVLRGMSFDKVRPIVLVIEATEPNSTKETHQAWEPYLLDKGYKFVYGDWLDLNYGFRLSRDDLSFIRQELRATAGVPLFRPTINYLKATQTDTTGLVTPVEEVTPGFSSTIYKYYTLSAYHRLALNPDPGPRLTSISLNYQDECFTFGITAQRDHTQRADVKSGDSILFRFYLKNIGGFQTDSVNPNASLIPGAPR